MRRSRLPTMALPLALGAALLAGCSDTSSEPTTSSAESESPAQEPTTQQPPASASVNPTPTPTRTRKPRPADPRWAFFTDDKTQYSSTWFPGRHRIMIGFGCTEAPYYSPDSSCSGSNGFHHGIDVAIPCGTPLRAGRRATVLANDALGSAYGESPVLLRVDGQDVVIGHTRRVYVDVGDMIRPGERFARVSDAGAPDGCHLHFEVRRPAGGVSDAVDPAPLLGLTP